MALKNNTSTNKGTTGNLLTDFIAGCREGVNTNFFVQIPNFIFAFVLIQVLQLTGLMSLINTVFAPIMGIFGLPGAAGAVLATGWLSTSGAIGSMVSMYESGILNATHIATLLAMCFMMGGQLQMLGRILGPAKVPGKYYAPLFISGWIGAIFVGILMNIIL